MDICIRIYILHYLNAYKGIIVYPYMVEYIECECGAIIRGNSKAHAESLLKIHKESKKHKEQMKVRGDMVKARKK